MRNLEKKHLAMLVFTVLAFLFLGYQIYQLMSSDFDNSHAATTVHKPKPIANAQPQALLKPAPRAVPKLMPSMLKNRKLAHNQKKYLELVNQYELAKMQKLLLNERVSIAQSQQRIAELDKKAGNLGGHALQVAFTDEDETMHLGYVDKQNDHWTAAIVERGHYETIEPGTILADGFQVTKIDKHGVYLEKQRARRLVTFRGTVSLPEKPLAQEKAEVKAKPLNPEVWLIPAGVAIAKAIDPIKPEVWMSPAALAIALTKDQPHYETVWRAQSLWSLKSREVSALTQPKLKVAKANTKVKAKVKVSTTPLVLKAQKTTTTRPPILMRAPSHYTVQLIGSYRLAAVQSFLKQNHIAEKADVFQLNDQGKSWYVAILGDYNNLADAQAALHKYPVGLKIHGPWIREYIDVQKAIRHVS